MNFSKISQYTACYDNSEFSVTIGTNLSLSYLTHCIKSAHEVAPHNNEVNHTLFRHLQLQYFNPSISFHFNFACLETCFPVSSKHHQQVISSRFLPADVIIYNGSYIFHFTLPSLVNMCTLLPLPPILGTFVASQVNIEVNYFFRFFNIHYFDCPAFCFLSSHVFHIVL